MAIPRIILVVLILNMLLVVGSIGFNYYLYQSVQQVANGNVTLTGTVAEETEEEQSEFLFFPINKVIVSLPGADRERYFVLDLVLQASLETEPKKLEQIDPMVRNSAVAHLSAMSFEQLRGLAIPELQTSLEKALHADFATRKVAAPFEHVLVSKLVVQ